MVLLKLLSFNIGGDTNSDNDKSIWSKRKFYLEKILLDNNPDIIGLQEVQKGNIKTLSKALKHYEYYHGLKNVYYTANKSYFNTIYWKKSIFEKIEQGAYYLSKTPSKWSKNWDATDVRSVTWVKLLHKTTGQIILHLNVHLDHRGKLSRLESSKLILNKLNKLIFKKNEIIIISGDFNERPWEPKYENVENYPPPVLPNYLPIGGKVYKYLLENNFVDSFIKAGNINKLDMNTYHDYHGDKFPPTALRIDWILYKAKPHIVITNKFSLLKNTNGFASDHFPIMAEFSFSGYSK